MNDLKLTSKLQFPIRSSIVILSVSRLPKVAQHNVHDHCSPLTQQILIISIPDRLLEFQLVVKPIVFGEPFAALIVFIVIRCADKFISI